MTDQTTQQTTTETKVTPEVKVEPKSDKQVFFEDKTQKPDAIPEKKDEPIVEVHEDKKEEGKTIATGATQLSPDDKKDETKDQKTEEKKEPAVEVKKEDLKLPEGSGLDATHVEGIVTYAKEQGLSLKQAQALLDRDNGLIKNSRQAGYEEFQSNVVKEKKAVARKWFEEAQADKDFGGQNFQKNAEKSTRVIETFFGPFTKQFLEASELGNNLEILRGFKKIGDLIGDDHLRRGDAPTKASGKHTKDVLFGEKTKPPNN